MKKNRPGVLLTVLTEPAHLAEIQDIIFAETSSFGLRMSERTRCILDRNFREIVTIFGPIKIKLGLRNGRIIQRSPEFESCRELAEKTGHSIREIFAAAISAAQAIR